VINYFKDGLVGGITGELDVPSNCINSCYDQQMCPEATAYGAGKMTVEMLGTELQSMLGSNFVYTADRYPSLKGFNANNAYVKLSTVPFLLHSGQTMHNMAETFALGGGADVTWTSTDTFKRYAEVVDLATDSVKVYKEGWLQLIATLHDTTHTVAFYTHKAPLIGTEANPFPIDNFSDLLKFRDGVNSATKFDYKHFIVETRSIDTWFGQTCDITIPSNYLWQDNNRIGKSDVIAFAGGYDGGGHEIQNLRNTSSNNYQGFFGYIEDGAVKNLGVRVSLFSPSSYSGPLCGQIRGNTKIDSCYSATTSEDVVLTLGYYSGGLIGSSYKINGSITNCINNCPIVSKQNEVRYVGGIIGHNSSIRRLVIRNCENKGSITGNILNLGGITALMHGLDVNTDSAWVEHCTNYGDLTSTSNS
jgi:hypothetical protein